MDQNRQVIYLRNTSGDYMMVWLEPWGMSLDFHVEKEWRLEVPYSPDHGTWIDCRFHVDTPDLHVWADTSAGELVDVRSGSDTVFEISFSAPEASYESGLIRRQRIIIINRLSVSIAVTIEPWESVVQIPPGDRLPVSIDGPPTGWCTIEFAVPAARIIVWPGASLQAGDRFLAAQAE
jgi:hypothetical protein